MPKAEATESSSTYSPAIPIVPIGTANIPVIQPNHPHRRSRVDEALDDALGLELAEAFGEHSITDAGDAGELSGFGQ